MIALCLALLAQDALVIRVAEGGPVDAPDGFGIFVGPGAEAAKAAGWTLPGETREIAGRKVAVVAARGASADLVVWVTELDREKAFARLKELKGVHLAVCSGRGTADAEPLRAGEAWLVPAPGASGVRGRIEVAFRDGKLEGVVSRREPAARPSEAAARLAASKGIDAPRKPALEGVTRALRFSLLGMSERPSYGGWTGPALVLDVELENLIPLALVKENKVPVQYRIPNLADHLYLVSDGRRVSRLRPEAAEWPGHLPLKMLTLDRQGARLRGNVVFDAAPSTSLELRYYDFSHGHVRIPLKGVPPAEKPLAGPSRNEAVELAVYGLKREAGKLLVDLRARSLIEIDSDATAFDPKARPGARFKMGTVADWKEARKHLQLVVDGELALAAEGYPDAPRFLPDLFTGGIAAFKAPEVSTSLELRCDFPNAGLPDGRVIRPGGLTILLEGAPPAPKEIVPIARIDDGVFQVDVAAQSLERGRLVLDVVVRNTGTSLEFFQTEPQLKYAAEDGRLLALDPSTFAGPRAPLPLLGVPPGARRAFQAVFAIPETERRPRLSYAGVTKAVIVNLRASEVAPAKPAACPSCKAEVAPADRFCAGCGAKLR